MTAKANGSINGGNVDFEGGLVLLPNSAYVNYEGTEYEVDPTTFSFVESALKGTAGQGGAEGGSAGVSGCQEEVGRLKVGEFIENGINEGSADVGGTGTTKVSGDLNVSGGDRRPARSGRKPGLQGPARRGRPAALEVRNRRSEERGEGRGEDRPCRRLRRRRQHRATDRGAAEDRTEERTAAARRSVEIDLDLKLTEVNEEQEISAPGNAKPLNDLFLKLGINPIELLACSTAKAAARHRQSAARARRSGRGGSSSGGGSGGEGGQQAYLKCLREARSPVDLQKCTQLLQ